MLKIVAVKHDEKDEIVKYKLSDGRILTKQEAFKLAQADKIQNAVVDKTKSGEMFLTSVSDGKGANKFNNLPEMNE